MRRRLLYYLFLLLPMGLLAQGWPANYGGVMLQGFYWDSYEDAKWTTLTSQADELSTYFNLIWVPNSGQTKEDRWNSPGNWGYENMGYMPVYWLKHNTCFGTQEELMQMIQTFKAKGTGFIEDVVINHKNGLTNWADFPNETVTGPSTGNTYSVTWATDMQDLWGICTDDELYANGGNHGDGVTYVSNSSAHAEEGTDNFDGCRDLDHVDTRVQQNIYTYLDYLIKELGYVGFRYDMVKGYKPYYTGLYNVHAQPQFSVGEYWDSDYNNVAGYWIKETGIPADGVIQSAAFDFPLKYKINEAFNNDSWSTLSNKGVAGDPDMSRYAVTFVDNHDTYRDNARLNNNVLAANAFILAMPGTPCVFLPHWKQYKPELKKMIAARKAAGITNQSPITAQYEVDNGNGYYLKVTGKQGSVILTLGDLRNTDVDLSGHTLVQSGDNFAFYLWDGVYNQNTYDAIDNESAKDIAVYVKDNGEGAPYLYVWNGGIKPNGDFPGTQFTESDKVTLADGTSWYKQTFHISSLNAIVTFNEGKQTSDVGPFTDDVYICYYKNDNLKHADYTSLYRGDVEAPTVHAYFDAPAGWNKAYAWCTKFYDIENKKYAGEWPGQTMEKVGKSSTGNDIYRWSIEKNLGEGVPDHIIFNNGCGGQTANLDFYNAAYYDQSGLAAESQLYFMPTVMRGASFVSGTNWDGASATLAEAGSGATMTHTLYYPAGEYTVQAIVRGTTGSTATLTVGTPGGSTNGTSSTDLTGLNGASSTVTIDGVVENAVTGTNNGWHKVQARYVLAEEGMLKLTLTSDASTWQVGAITILKSADSQDNYHTTATWQPTETNANVVGMHHFSFYDRGVNKNALVTAATEQAPALLPCNSVVNGTCSRLALTDGAYDFSATSGFTANVISYDRTFQAGKKSTVCLPFAVTAAEMAEQGIKAYEFNGLTSKGGFHFSPVEVMEANHPYVVEAEGKPFAYLEGRAVAQTDNLETTADNVTFRGTMQRTLLTSGDEVYYGYSNGIFVKVGNRVGVNPFRAYIVTSSEMGSSVEAVFDESDGIRELSSVVSGATDDIFTLDGRKVAASSRGDLPKGVYICNGRKFVVK